MSEVDVFSVEPDDSRVDRLIWRDIGLKPVKDIAEAAGVEPQYVLRRSRELMESVDVLTVEQKRVRLLIELEGMARDARKKAEAMPPDFYAGTLNAAVGAIKAQLVELARMEKQNSGAVDALNALRVKELLRIVETATVQALEVIAGRYNLDSTELLDVFQEFLVQAAASAEAEGS